MKVLGGAGRPRFSAVVAIVGMTIAGFSVAMLGAGALLTSGSAELESSRNASAGPASPDTASAAPSAPAAPSGPDTMEEALNQPSTPLVTDPKAVVDTDAERIRFSGFEKECMRSKGFDWRDAAVDPLLSSEAPPGSVSRTAGQEPAELAAVNDALFGSTGQGDTYRWEEAGCHGYAVHMTGNDGNH